jgi:hypothetical protein
MPKYCQSQCCPNIASYGFDGKRTHCFKHKEEGMTSRKVCKTEGDIKSPSFGYDGKRTHCGQYKVEGMTDNKDKRCKKKGTTWGYVYKLTNPENCMSYVGSTHLTPEARFKEHKKKPISKKMKSVHDKIRTFTIEVLEYGFYPNDGYLYSAEDDYITKYDTIRNGYNTKYNGTYRMYE